MCYKSGVIIIMILVAFVCCVQRCHISGNFRISENPSVPSGNPPEIRRTENFSGLESDLGKLRKFCQALVASLCVLSGDTATRGAAGKAALGAGRTNETGTAGGGCHGEPGVSVCHGGDGNRLAAGRAGM